MYVDERFSHLLFAGLFIRLAIESDEGRGVRVGLVLFMALPQETLSNQSTSHLFSFSKIVSSKMCVVFFVLNTSQIVVILKRQTKAPVHSNLSQVVVDIMTLCWYNEFTNQLLAAHGGKPGAPT